MLALFAAAAAFRHRPRAGQDQTIIDHHESRRHRHPPGRAARSARNSVPDQSFEVGRPGRQRLHRPGEAKDMGILNFAKADTARRGCLGRAEYEHALIS